MTRRLPISAFLVFALLFAQLATVWHSVEHLHVHPTAAEQALSAANEHRAELTSFQRAIANHTLSARRLDGTENGHAEDDSCLLLHFHACQFAWLPDVIETVELRYRHLTPHGWPSFVVETSSDHTYLIRGPPTQS